MAGASRERHYQDKFIELGFYYVTDCGLRKLQCVICFFGRRAQMLVHGMGSQQEKGCEPLG